MISRTLHKKNISESSLLILTFTCLVLISDSFKKGQWFVCIPCVQLSPHKVIKYERFYTTSCRNPEEEIMSC